MPEPIIQLNQLHKTYTISEREAGLGAALRSLIKRQTRKIHAVDGITFTIEQGEVVGFLGPNGAGKTTTLKMLTGLLHPTKGEVSVFGYTPWRRDKAFLRQITLVMGQRNQLVWDIPTIDSFELNRVIFNIPQKQYRQTLDELTELLDLEPLLQKPVRNLSLGERMKCEIAGALLHRPKVLFLDEPTIGLDVTAQRRIRTFIGEYNCRYGATVMLTSHYMADVEALCQRVIVIDHGRILFDGPLAKLVARFSPHKTIVVDLLPGATGGRGAEALVPFGEVVAYREGQATLRVPKKETAVITAKLINALPIQDLTIQDPPIEDVIEQLFNSDKKQTTP
ncbi:MAG: ATP-binding cassette domain-containing protein [Candidatus Promineifilaceae bacterium]